jgi:hypothetical protein
LTHDHDLMSRPQFEFSDESELCQPALALKGIIKPDSFVQFFLRADEKRFKINETVPTERRPKPGGLYSFTAIGAVPPTVHTNPPSARVVNKTVETPNFAYLRPGHFGAVSESGMFLRSAAVKDEQQGSAEEHSQRTPMLSKVSSPFSYFYRDFRPAKDRKRDEAKSLARWVYYSEDLRPAKDRKRDEAKSLARRVYSEDLRPAKDRKRDEAKSLARRVSSEDLRPAKDRKRDEAKSLARRVSYGDDLRLAKDSDEAKSLARRVSYGDDLRLAKDSDEAKSLVRRYNVSTRYLGVPR